MTDQVRDIRVCVLLVCFAGAKRASKIRRAMGQRIREQGDAVLDTVVLTVDPKRRVQVHDPRKVVAGTLVAGSTWGLFGLVTGGLQGFGFWAVLGVICGGLFAYYRLNRFTKDERKRIAEHLPVDSSALAAFVKGSDPERILGATAPFGSAVASVAAIGSDLSAQVWTGSDAPADSGARRASSSEQAAQLSMLLVRFAGEHAAAEALSVTGGSAKDAGPAPPIVELVVEANERGKRRVIDPSMGSAAVAKADIVSWGGFGLVYGVIAGFAGDGGILGAIESGIGWAIACGAFGIVAGALFGLWAGRSVSARRLKEIGPLVPPDSSLALAWAGGSVSSGAIGSWMASGSHRLLVRFVAEEQGLLMDVATS